MWFTDSNICCDFEDSFGGDFSLGSILTIGAVAVFGAAMEELIENKRNSKEELLKNIQLHNIKEFMDFQEAENSKREFDVTGMESEGKISREEAEIILNSLKT